MRVVENKAKRQHRADSKDGGALLNSYMQQLYSREADQVTIHYAIKDKLENMQKSRKDSILEFSQRRERTKSQAVDDMSVSTVNQFVQQLINKDFSIFSQEQPEASVTDKFHKEK
jgi:hypothetical protein